MERRMPFLHRDETALFYDWIDGDKETVLLIHGWCCDHRFLKPQADHFASKGHSILSLDLRGHGQSDKPGQPYPIAGFAEDIAWICDQLSVTRCLVIGHSMGGTIAFDLAMRRPDLARAVVMLDSSVLPTEASRSALPAIVAELRGADHRGALRRIASSTFFLPTDDPARCNWILDVMSAAPQHVMSEAYAGIADFDVRAALDRISVPMLYIAANEPAPRSDIVALGALFPAMQFGRTVGSGHFCQLEVPDQVNAMIARFAALALPRP
jgi:pimeloyl-ACP methyl ester carboxylesterase